MKDNNENMEAILMRQYIEPVWEKNWQKTQEFAHKNLSLFYTFKKMPFTVQDMKNLLITVEEMIGFRIDDSFELDGPQYDFVFKSENLQYRNYLRCRYIHSIIHTEFPEYLNPGLDPNMKMEVGREPTLFLRLILFFPKLK
jgi:hypothetical protein